MGQPPTSAMYYSNPLLSHSIGLIMLINTIQADRFPSFVGLLSLRFCVLSTFIPWIVEEMLQQLILT